MSRAGRCAALLLAGLLALPGTGVRASGGVCGTVLSLDSLRAPGLLPRPVHVWLPPGWEEATDLPLIVAHDGQNLFDPARSFSGVDWDLDGQLDSLIRRGSFRPVAVAAVGNTVQRRRDYMPDDLFQRLSPAEQDSFVAAFGGGPLGDAYLDALADTLVPALRRRFPLSRRPAETALLGSSRGALISVAGLARHADVFGRAYAFSTHWPAAGSALVPWLAAALPEPAGRFLYLDRGERTPCWRPWAGRRAASAPPAPSPATPTTRAPGGAGWPPPWRAGWACRPTAARYLARTWHVPGTCPLTHPARSPRRPPLATFPPTETPIKRRLPCRSLPRRPPPADPWAACC